MCSDALAILHRDIRYRYDLYSRCWDLLASLGACRHHIRTEALGLCAGPEGRCGGAGAADGGPGRHLVGAQMANRGRDEAFAERRRGMRPEFDGHVWQEWRYHHGPRDQQHDTLSSHLWCV